MKIGFVINDVETEDARYTTTRLSRTAHHMGHETWTMGVGDFVYDPDGSIRAHARRAPKAHYDSLEDYLADLQSDDAAERLAVDDLDVLWLRNNPADDAVERPWAAVSGILFGRMAVRRGVIVLNDPSHLAHALNKTYFEHFPAQVRPKTLISRSPEEIRGFIEAQKNKAVIKPLQGSGGQGVFVVKGKADLANVNQMIEAVLRDGYVIVQEFLPAAVEGDVRLFVMNGRALEHDGKHAAFRRVNKTGDARSNMHAGGKSEPAEVDEHMLELVEMVRPKLVRDGMFLVGLDIAGNKLMEINVFSPGGLGSIERFTGVDFMEIVIRDLERKVKYRQYYGRGVGNTQIATL
ncbi:MAG: glutathione synthetase [Planctomycetaceae bacterium]